MRSPFLFVSLVFTLSTATAFAQQQDPVMTCPQLKPFEKIEPVIWPVQPKTDSTAPRQSINSLYRNNWYKNGVLVDTVPMGKVYRMPLDNMHCLVPYAKNPSRMPVKKAKAVDPMPNPYRRH